MKRLPDWRIRLSAALDEIEAMPHSFAGHDCAIGLGSTVVEAVTGVDIAAPFRGRYSTAEGALKLIRTEGAKDLPDLLERYFERVPASEGRAGDIAMIEGTAPFGCALGCFIGERIIVLRPEGKGSVDRSQAIGAFRVGDDA